MRPKMRVSAGTLAIVAVAIGLVLFVATPIPAAAGYPLWCHDAFPTTCTQGGCDAQEGWYAQGCTLYCSPTLLVACTCHPQK